MQKTLVIVLIVVIVALAGILIWQNLGNKISVESNLPQENEQVNSDENAEWKIYTNDKFGYTVEYPFGWHYKDYNDVTIDNVLLSRVVFSDKVLPSDIGKMDPSQSISIWVENRPFAEARTAFLQGPFINTASETIITVDNMQVTKLSGIRKGAKYSSVEVMISKDGKIYTMVGIDSPSVSAAFNRVLSTFKFTK